jgi:pimeloyl-ACP methyl ester carboxylesterase
VTIHLRKMYVDSRYGQLHMHTAFPSSGGFDELTPLICIGTAAHTGRAFRPLLRDLGRDRSAYAPDLPGSGESDGPRESTGVADCMAGCLDLIDSLKMRRVDVLGYQAGSTVAIELALARPEQVRRVALVGVPVAEAGFPAGERLPLLKQPVMIVRARDEYWESTGRTESLLRDARRFELPNFGANLLDAGTDAISNLAREFFDR